MRFEILKSLFLQNKKNNSGFTLIELLLYIALASFILLAISVVLSFTIRSRIKNQAITEVFDQGNNVLQIITQQARNSISINSPATSTNATLLSLAMASSSFNPSIFSLSAGTIRVTEGVSSSIALTSSRVVVSDVLFSNLSRTGTPGIIRVKFTLSHTNPSGRNEYNYSKTFYGSANIKY